MPDVRGMAEATLLKVLDFVETAKERPEKVSDQKRWSVRRREIVESIQEGNTKLGDSQSWKLSRYAVICLADDLLKRLQWPGRNWWVHNLLEAEMFQTAEGSEEFFHSARSAAQISDRSALTVFYLCGILGLRGFYGEPDALARAQQLGFPLSFEAWIAETSAAVRASDVGEPDSPKRDPLEGAGPLFGRKNFHDTLLLTFGLGFLTCMLGLVLGLSHWNIFG